MIKADKLADNIIGLSWIIVLAAVVTTSRLHLVGYFTPNTARAQGTTSVLAQTADSFVESMGINVHLHYDDTAYAAFQTVIKPRLRELGIRHLRDGIVHRRPDKVAMMRDLEALGFKFLLNADPRGTTAVQARDYVKQFPSVVMVEGPNEPDLGLGENWITVARDYQKQLYQEIKNDPATRSLPVLATSLVNNNSFDRLGDISQWADYANLHNYYGGRNPGTPGWGDNGYGSITWQMDQARKVTPNRKILSTETGWHNYVDNPGGHRGTPEGVVAKYLPRLFFMHFNSGFIRSYPYEFIDERNNPYDLENNFGLLRYDGSPKPAYTALKNLISLLNDPGPTFTPGTLSYSLSGNLNNVKQTLLQKRDGTFYLALWVEGYNWEPDAKVELAVPPQRVLLTVNAPLTQAAICAPNDGTSWRDVPVVNQQAIHLDVPDKVLLVKLQPALSGKPSLASVSAASFRRSPLAVDSLVTSFGVNLAAQTLTSSPATSLPLVLGGTRVVVRDSSGTERLSPLMFVSPAQVSYLIPTGTAVGEALISVISDAGAAATEQVRIDSVAPGLFSGNSNGRGVASGVVLRVRADGRQSYEPLSIFDASTSRMVARPIELGAPEEQVYLVLFGTGFRHGSTLTQVQAWIGGVMLPVLYAGPQGTLPGLDQLNVRLTRELSGRGEITVEAWFDIQRANLVTIAVK